MKIGQIRVWHEPKISGERFTILAKNPAEAMKFLDIIADYDIFLTDKNIREEYSNNSGFEVWNGSNWIDAECKTFNISNHLNE